MSEFRLDGKNALVAAGGRDLLQAAQALAEAGAHLTIQAETPEELAAAHKAEAALGTASVTVVAQQIDGFAAADRTVAGLAAARGSVDIYLAPAPPEAAAALADLDEQAFEPFVRRYLKRAVGLARAAARLMVEQDGGGRIISFARSTTFFAPGAERAIAGAAMLSLTSAVAGSLAGRGVTANSVILGAADGYQGGVPLADTAQDVDLLGPTVAFLCAPAASGITGRYVYCAGRDVGLFTMPMIMDNANVQIRFAGQAGPDTVGEFVLPLANIGKA